MDVIVQKTILIVRKKDLIVRKRIELSEKGFNCQVNNNTIDIGANILNFQCFGHNSTHKAPLELIPELATTIDNLLCAGSVKTRFKAVRDCFFLF